MKLTLILRLESIFPLLVESLGIIQTSLRSKDINLRFRDLTLIVHLVHLRESRTTETSTVTIRTRSRRIR